KETVVDAWQRTDLPSNHARGAAFGHVNLDAYGISPVACVVGCLIDAHGESARDRRGDIAARANQEGLGGIFIADAPDQRATPRFIKGQDTEKVLEASRKALRTIVLLCVDVA